MKWRVLGIDLQFIQNTAGSRNMALFGKQMPMNKPQWTVED